MRIEESLYFANIGKIKEMFSRIEQFGDTKEVANAQKGDSLLTVLALIKRTSHTQKKGPPLQAIVIDGRNIQEMDAR